ncbi:diguanylate cyclase [Photobacterium aquimaris]|uniref:diguanylate cyclase n=1 Tax=Photobacterium aquimaris TaxID=512643 RepID=A0A2T3HWI4_9GAMM|nr:diguanylate cyclase [Photobacterium aquimaris]OBU22979.1 diguanylate cyclase response regulator [Photobacterium aquimaris]PQJ38745.1 diguanylate cyclase response regulator [Photobacterium aquimaris]PSU03350.1 diguanylate cyclase response regulator [Photobacterium aquimaris]
MGVMRILIADDVASERLYLTACLTNLGHIVKSVSSGAELLRYYSEFNPDLLLIDIEMPEQNGIELVHTIRHQYQEWVPVIFLSGLDDPHIIAKAIDVGGDDYLVKPVNAIILAAKIQAMSRIAVVRQRLEHTTIQLQKINKLLLEQANEDPLTKLANRRYLDQKLKEFIALHGRNNLPLTIILLDVDFFKLFNDFQGHIEGDNCLKLLSTSLNKIFNRAGEVCGRYGGEEFIVLICNCDEKQAIKECQRLKDEIFKLAIPHENSLISNQLTVSQGAISWVPTGLELVENLYQAVDALLYQAKDNGRDQFVTAEYPYSLISHNEN